MAARDVLFYTKLGENLTEPYELHQAANRLTGMSRMSAFSWHKCFKEGRQKLKIYEIYGSDRNVKRPELLEKIRSYLDEYSCESIKKISKQLREGGPNVYRIIYEHFTISKKVDFIVVSGQQKENSVNDKQ